MYQDQGAKTVPQTLTFRRISTGSAQTDYRMEILKY